MINLFKILLTLMIFISITNANEVKQKYKYDAFDDLYYSGISERLSAWIPVGIGEKATVRVTIDKNGKFEYEFKKITASDEFKQNLTKFLEDQKKIRYPVNRDRFIDVLVEFKSEYDPQ